MKFKKKRKIKIKENLDKKNTQTYKKILITKKIFLKLTHRLVYYGKEMIKKK